MTLAEAELRAEEYRLAIAHADLARQVRIQFALGIAARDNLTLAQENEARARELSRIARELVATGKEPPLRGLLAGAALAEATAAPRRAEADATTAPRPRPPPSAAAPPPTH